MENYQITLGSESTEDAVVGSRTGPGFPAEEITIAIERIVLTYLKVRLNSEETFLETYKRIGMAQYKTALYDAEAKVDAAE